MLKNLLIGFLLTSLIISVTINVQKQKSWNRLFRISLKYGEEASAAERKAEALERKFRQAVKLATRWEEGYMGLVDHNLQLEKSMDEPLAYVVNKDHASCKHAAKRLKYDHSELFEKYYRVSAKNADLISKLRPAAKLLRDAQDNVLHCEGALHIMTNRWAKMKTAAVMMESSLQEDKKIAAKAIKMDGKEATFYRRKRW